MRAAAVLLVLAAAPGWGEVKHRLYGCGITSRGWVVGQRLLPSGLFERIGEEWRRLGFLHPVLTTLDYDPRDPRVLYIAAGNGCIRSADGGNSFRITTGWEVTELQDVAVDPNAPDSVWVALPDGVLMSRNQGQSWERREPRVGRRFMQSIRVDRWRAGRVLAGGELGIFLSDDEGRRWRQVFSGGQVTDIAQSPHTPGWWMAATQDSGVWSSRDGGIRWARVEGVAADRAIYNVSFDATSARRVAVSGWGVGVMVSEDEGQHWQRRTSGLPGAQVWRVAFDPDAAGRMWASVHEEAVYVSENAGERWRVAGLPGSILYDLVFVPEVRR